jgi:hypothetical protein
MTWDRHKNVTGIILLIGSNLSPIDNWRSNCNTYIIYKQTIKQCTDLLPLKKITYYHKNECVMGWFTGDGLEGMG